MDESATKDFVDRAVAAERSLTDEKFKSRDLAIELLRTEKKDTSTTYIAIVAALLSLAAIVITLLKSGGR
jgi:hypothetical protein